MNFFNANIDTKIRNSIFYTPPKNTHHIQGFTHVRTCSPGTMGASLREIAKKKSHLAVLESRNINRTKIENSFNHSHKSSKSHCYFLGPEKGKL